MTGLIILLAAAFLISATLAVFWRLQLYRTLKRIDDMLTAAQRDHFKETFFDESQLSALETKMAQFLTATAKTKQRLAREQTHIQTLVSDISHQSKTPIANLLLYSQLLSENPQSERDATCIRAIVSQTERLQHLVDALVKSSRLEHGMLVLKPTPMPLNSLIEAVCATYADMAARRGIKLHCEATSLVATYDLRWSEEALGNLVDNALKYTPYGGHVQIAAKDYATFSAIAVHDDGPGIPDDEQNAIFQRFVRGQKAQHSEGVGIGLYLAQQIAQAQGGYIRLISSPGKGSTFTLFLPH